MIPLALAICSGLLQPPAAKVQVPSPEAPAPPRVHVALEKLKINYDSRPTATARGDFIVFAATLDARVDLYAVSPGDPVPGRLTDTPEAELFPALSPSGESVAYSVNGASAGGPAHICLLDLKTQGRLILTQGEALDIQPTFSPDSAWVYFSRAKLHRPYSMGGMTWDHYDLFRVEAATGKTEQLTQNDFHSMSPPSVSPDGKRVVFSADVPAGDPAKPGDLQPKVFVLNLGVDRPPVVIGPQHHFLAKPQTGSGPTFSPDGRHVAFISDSAVPFRYEVWMVGADGQGPRQVTHNGSYNATPTFTGGGKEILFLSDPERSNVFHLRVVGVDGSDDRAWK
jgi:Tol biopolymer transport system component